MLKEKINYCKNNYPCRVNNLSGYAKSKRYQEKEYLQVMMAALKDLAVSDFPYNVLSNNCGHMVTIWKYGVRFNPEVGFVKGPTRFTDTPKISVLQLIKYVAIGLF